MAMSSEYLKGKEWIKEIVVALERSVDDGVNGFELEYDDSYVEGYFSKKTAKEFKNAIRLIKRVDAYLDCMYGMLEVDEGYWDATENQELFHKRLKELGARR